MIDTSIYENITDSNKYLPCYQKFAELNSVALPIRSTETIDTLRAYQLTKIQEAIGTNTFSNIIMSGHHPIQQLKLKKEKDKIFTDIEDFKVVLKEIYRLTSTSKFYYLCSELHLYQEGTIHLPVDDSSMEIKQYIVGTGGTELDSMPLGNNGNELYDGITSIKECGFLACDVTGSKPMFTFIPVTSVPLTVLAADALTALTADASGFSGGKRKRRSKKYKKR